MIDRNAAHKLLDELLDAFQGRIGSGGLVTCVSGVEPLDEAANPELLSAAKRALLHHLAPALAPFVLSQPRQLTPPPIDPSLRAIRRGSMVGRGACVYWRSKQPHADGKEIGTEKAISETLAAILSATGDVVERSTVYRWLKEVDPDLREALDHARTTGDARTAKYLSMDELVRLYRRHGRRSSNAGRVKNCD